VFSDLHSSAVHLWLKIIFNILFVCASFAAKIALNEIQSESGSGAWRREHGMIDRSSRPGEAPRDGPIVSYGT